MGIGLKREDDRTAMSRRGNDFEVGADELGPFPHDAQPDMRFVQPLFIAVEADAVVLHCETPRRLLLHVQTDMRCVSVLAHVGQGFLNDM